MKLSDFTYDLPKELIAQYPLKKRDESRLMVLEREKGEISHHKFSEILNYLYPSDTLILNNTKVVTARLYGRKKDTNAKAEMFLLNHKGEGIFSALLRPRLKIGQKINFASDGLLAEIIDEGKVRFNTSDLKKIYSFGRIPLPPYIKREADVLDLKRYQTVYARNKGAVAAPTAGLHFTKDLLNRLKQRGINLGYLTLHIGWGTFKPIRCSDITQHKMEEEYFQIPSATLELIKKTRQKGGRIFAVGTSSARALESLKDDSCGYQGWTNLFIYPGYNFKNVDCLLTNFHLPHSTLLLLVCAFAGRDLIMQAYQEAIKNNYRFYSYGDCMLII